MFGDVKRLTWLTDFLLYKKVWYLKSPIKNYVIRSKQKVSLEANFTTFKLAKVMLSFDFHIVNSVIVIILTFICEACSRNTRVFRLCLPRGPTSECFCSRTDTSPTSTALASPYFKNLCPQAVIFTVGAKSPLKQYDVQSTEQQISVTPSFFM